MYCSVGWATWLVDVTGGVNNTAAREAVCVGNCNP